MARLNDGDSYPSVGARSSAVVAPVSGPFVEFRPQRLGFPGAQLGLQIAAAATKTTTTSTTITNEIYLTSQSEQVSFFFNDKQTTSSCSIVCFFFEIIPDDDQEQQQQTSWKVSFEFASDSARVVTSLVSCLATGVADGWLLRPRYHTNRIGNELLNRSKRPVALFAGLILS